MHGLKTIVWMNRPENAEKFLHPGCPWPHPGGVVMSFWPPEPIVAQPAVLATMPIDVAGRTSAVA